MGSINKLKACLILLLFLATFMVLMDIGTSVKINPDVTYASHNLKYLPGTPVLKNGYEITSEGIRPVIEAHQPRLIAVN